MSQLLASNIVNSLAKHTSWKTLVAVKRKIGSLITIFSYIKKKVNGFDSKIETVEQIFSQMNNWQIINIIIKTKSTYKVAEGGQ